GTAKGMPVAAPANRTGEDKPVLESQVAALEHAEVATPPREGGRRRGRRGGRKEREHREAAANGETQRSMEPVNTAPAGPTEYIAYPDGFVRPSEYIAMPAVYTPSMPAVLAPTMPAVIEANLPQVVPENLPAIASPPPVAIQPQVAAPAPAPVQSSPPVQSSASVAAPGLIQIETDPIKLETVPEYPAGASERHAPRRRHRQREVYVENEPLVQIETQHTQQG
ncbi:MAG: hypothetical protein WCA64_08520, partial [Gallionella sp.]